MLFVVTIQIFPFVKYMRHKLLHFLTNTVYFIILSFPFHIRYILFQITNLMHNSFFLQQYVCYITILNMFRAAPCSSSGGQIVLLQPQVSSPSVNSHTVCRWRADCSPLSTRHTVRLLTEGDDTRGCGDTIGPPDDEQRAARNMLRSVM